MGRGRKLIWLGAIAPVAAILLVVAAWAIDTGVAGGEVVRNVELAGSDIGGRNASELLEHIESLDAEMRSRPVHIVTPERTYETTAGEIGLSIDARRTARLALDVGRSDPLPVRPLPGSPASSTPGGSRCATTSTPRPPGPRCERSRANP